MGILETQTGCSLADNKLAIANRVRATKFNYSSYPKLDMVECDLCGHSDFYVYSHQDRYCLPVRSLACANCGLIFISPRMTLEAYNEFYAKWYRKLVDAFSNRKDHSKDLAFTRQIQADNLIAFLKKHLPRKYPKGEMLDIGGAIGTFAKKCSIVFEFDPMVIDPCQEDIEEATKNGLEAYVAGIETFQFVDKQFSFVSMLKTIEHVYSISFALKRIYQMLVDGGYALIDCIDHKWLTSFLPKELSTKIDHIYQLTEDTINRYFDQTGFEVQAVEREQRYVTFLVKKRNMSNGEWQK